MCIEHKGAISIGNVLVRVSSRETVGRRQRGAGQDEADIAVLARANLHEDVVNAKVVACRVWCQKGLDTKDGR